MKYVQRVLPPKERLFDHKPLHFHVAFPMTHHKPVMCENEAACDQKAVPLVEELAEDILEAVE